MGVQGFLPAASPATGNATIYSNSFFEPFNTSKPLTTGWSTFSLTDASSTTQPFPFSAELSSLYGIYRVDQGSLRVTAVCGAGADTMNFWLLPVPLNSAGTTALYAQALGNAGVKTMMLTSGCRPLVLESNIRAAEILGRSQTMYMPADALIGGAPSGVNATEWQVYYATLDGGVTTGQVYFNFDLKIVVELSSPVVVDN